MKRREGEGRRGEGRGVKGREGEGRGGKGREVKGREVKGRGVKGRGGKINDIAACNVYVAYVLRNCRECNVYRNTFCAIAANVTYMLHTSFKC